jgi:hypothetical protein
MCALLLTCSRAGHTAPVTCVAFADNHTVTSASADGSVRLYCASSGSELTAIAPHAHMAVTSLAVVGSGDALRVMTVRTRACARAHMLSHTYAQHQAGGDGCVVASEARRLRTLLSVRHGRDVRAAFVTTGGDGECTCRVRVYASTFSCHVCQAQRL